nr:sensor histidine kinase [Streptococcus sp. DD10]
MNFKDFLKHYLLSRRRYFYIQLIFFLFLLLFFYLFRENRSVLEYLLGILFFLTLLFIFLDSSFVYQNYRKEILYEEGIAESPLESHLQTQIRSLKDENQRQKIEAQFRVNDLLDYYTLWGHQIKTPIAAMTLLLQDLDGETKKLLEQELFKIDGYVGLVLHYLRLESFHDDLVLKEESIEEMVKEVVRKHALFFIQKGLTLDLKGLDVSIVTDKKWFLVILEQLLSNSLKYTKKGKVSIYYKDSTLFLQDTGIGIKNSDILRVFERGFSGYNGRLTHQSSGLGLYLSKKIADRLGLKLSIQSEVGVGTTVKIFFAQEDFLVE